ncbi:MAG: succinate dehydrogenase/fumarate reductase cytochrome b subunit, b558 family [Bacteroidetes bacterium]|nr:MAG: succinate dehydrogenase/fumarate reductase cytochrome b subunit, b558 family [Bacteroidota bacterium]
MANKVSQYLQSSIGKKTVMAATGLFLVVFLLEHLYTNVLLFFGDGGKAFNDASHGMVHSIIIRIIEVVLFVSIVLHVIQALMLTGQNNKARPVKYAVSGVSKTSSWFSRNMLLTGSIIFFFIVVHLYNFFVPYRVTGTVNGPEDPANNLAIAVAEALGDPMYAALYLVSVLFLAFHLNHGFQSAFQTAGLNNRRYAPLWKMAGSFLAFIVFGLGFASFPVLFYLSKVMEWDLLNWAK